MKFYLLALLFAIAHAEQPFRVKDGKNNTCLLLQLDGSLNLAATPLNSSDTAPQPVSLAFKNASVVEAASNCTLIKLNMTKSAEVWFQFTEDTPDNWKVTPISAFIPSEVFGSEDNETVTFQADALEVFEKNNSFLCNSKEDHQFKQQGTPSKKFNYTVTASTADFRIQSLAGEDFTNATTECQADKKSTSTPTTPTSSTSTHAPSSTTPAPEPVLNVTCTEKNVTRIRLTGSFELAITYYATDPKTNKTTAKTEYIPVPGNVKTDGSKCEANASTETLSLDFFEGWNINFVILSDSSSAQLAAGSGEYHVANITVTYTFDKHLPSANETGHKEAVYKDGGKNYLKATASGYYTCKANTSINMGPDQVKLTMKDLKYKAFNDKGDAEFKGDVSECSADDDTSSVVPIAVGAALAGLVVIVLIAYLIGRKRSRKSGYESV